MVKTKIICTLGPASSDAGTLRKMMIEGMDVARLNFSHGSFTEHQSRADTIRKLNKKYKRHVRLLQDLEGYRIRIGRLKGGQIELKKNQFVFLAKPGAALEAGFIPFDYSGPFGVIKPGHRIFIDDGNIALKVRSRTKYVLKCEVIIPGVLKDHKGVNMPDTRLKFKGLTEKDKHDIGFGIKNGVDFIAQSFVRDKDDILHIRALLKDRYPECRLIAKIENRDGIKNIGRILDAADGIMVARGDMGVSIPIFQIPIVQKEIIRKCNERKKFVITATQMLESMTEHLMPTRAEVTDVSNAVFDGTDMVMLSGETAVGKHPVETVRMMNQILKYTEAHLPRYDKKRARG
jgi:pyruvate kinase